MKCCLTNKNINFILFFLSGFHVADAGLAKIPWTVENVLVAEMVGYVFDLISTLVKSSSVANGSVCAPSVKTGL